MWKLIHSVLQAGFTSNAKLSAAALRLQTFQLAALKSAHASSPSAALRQPCYSSSHLTPHHFDKYFTTERGHCPGAPGSTVKECANETTAQPNRCNMKIHWASFTQARCGQSREQKWHLHQSMTPLQEMQYGNPRFLSSHHPCSPYHQPFPGLEHAWHHNSLTWHPPMHWHCQSLLLFPPLQDTTYLQPSLWRGFHLIINSFGQRWSFIMCWYSAQKNGVLIPRHYCNINNNNSLLLAFSNSRSFTGRWQVMLTCLSTAQK